MMRVKKRMNNIAITKQKYLYKKLNVVISYNVIDDLSHTNSIQEGYVQPRDVQIFIKRVIKDVSYGIIVEVIKNNLVVSCFSDDPNLAHNELDYIISRMPLRVKELIAIVRKQIKDKKAPTKDFLEEIIRKAKYRVGEKKKLILAHNASSFFSSVCNDILRLYLRNKELIIRTNGIKIRGI